MVGNSKEEKGISILKCPECCTTFEIHSMQKMFPKEFIIFLILGTPFSALPIEINIIFILIFTIPVLKWLFKPENIVINNKNT